MRKLFIIFALLTCALSLRAQTPSVGFPDDGKIHGSFNPQQKVTMTSASTTSAVATIVLATSPGGATLPWTVTGGMSVVFEGSTNSAMNSFIGTVGTVTDQQHFTVNFTGQPNGTSTGGFVAPDDWNNKAVPASAGGSYLDGLGTLPGGLGGATVYRLTADENSFHDYSTVSPVSENGTYVLVHGGSGGNGDRFIGGCPGANCGVVIVNNATITGAGTTGCQRGGSDWYLHDPLNDNVYFYSTGTSLMSCTINGTNSVTSAVIHNFSGTYTNWIVIPDETDIVVIGGQRYILLIGQNAAVGGVSTVDIFTYNLDTNTKSHIYTTPTNGCVLNPGNTSSSGPQVAGDCIHKNILMTDGTPVIQWQSNASFGGTNADANIIAAGCDLTKYSCNTAVSATGGTLTMVQGDSVHCAAQNGCSSHFDRSENQAGTASYIVEVDEPPGFGNQPADNCFKQNGMDYKNYTLASSTNPATVCLSAMANIGHISSHSVSSTMPYVGASIDPWQAGYFTTSANFRMPSLNCAIPFQTANNYGVNACWFLYQDEAFLISINSAGSTTAPGITSGSLYRIFWNYSDATDTSTPSGGFYSQSKESVSPDGQHIVFTSTMACPNGYSGVNGCTSGKTLTDVWEVSLTYSGVVLSPSSQPFGSVTVGSSSGPFTFTLTNNSGSTLTGITVSNVGGNTADFVNQGTGTCGSTLTNGSSCTIIYKFVPSTRGTETTTLNVADSDASSPQQSSLSGSGISSTTPSVISGKMSLAGNQLTK